MALTNEELTAQVERTVVNENDLLGNQDSAGASWYKITFTTIKTWIIDVVWPIVQIVQKGLANTTTDPGTPTKNEVYNPIKRGFYTNFDNKPVYQGEISKLRYDRVLAAWQKDTLALNNELNSIADPFFIETDPSTGLPYGWTSTGTDVYSVSDGEIEHVSDFQDGRLVYGLSGLPFAKNGDFFRLYLELYIPAGFTGGNPSFRMWNTTTSGGFYQPDNIFTDDTSEGWHILYFEGYMTDIPGGEEITDIRIDVFVKEVGVKIRRPWLSFNRHTQALDHYINQGNRAFNKKLVTLGDSITHQAQWQGELIKNISAYWSVDETRYGVRGFAPMGVSSATVRPVTRFWTISDPIGVQGALAKDHDGNQIYEPDLVTPKYWFLGRGPEDSLFVRSPDVVQYSPDTIIVFGGTNDGLQTTWDLNDLPYDGGGAGNGDDWFLPEEAGAPTFVSSFKGMLKQIVTDNPLAQVYCLPIYYKGSTPFTPSEVEEYKSNRDLIKALSDEFSCEFVDLLNVGISPYNSINYLADGIHPSLAGGKLIANYIAKHVK